ncbi:hypothetical protein GCM10009824_12560 [Kocuria atrinae]|uniref:Uncharacterized protein n=1 Tax=Kocuria atrinae TaxID=592377 RepID=A0ABP5JAM1_9MICC
MVLSVLMDVSVPFAASLVVMDRGTSASAVMMVQLIAVPAAPAHLGSEEAAERIAVCC